MFFWFLAEIVSTVIKTVELVNLGEVFVNSLCCFSYLPSLAGIVVVITGFCFVTVVGVGFDTLTSTSVLSCFDFSSSSGLGRSFSCCMTRLFGKVCVVCTVVWIVVGVVVGVVVGGWVVGGFSQHISSQLLHVSP